MRTSSQPRGGCLRCQVEFHPCPLVWWLLEHQQMGIYPTKTGNPPWSLCKTNMGKIPKRGECVLWLAKGTVWRATKNLVKGQVFQQRGASKFRQISFNGDDHPHPWLEYSQKQVSEWHHRDLFQLVVPIYIDFLTLSGYMNLPDPKLLEAIIRDWSLHVIYTKWKLKIESAALRYPFHDGKITDQTIKMLMVFQFSHNPVSRPSLPSQIKRSSAAKWSQKIRFKLSRTLLKSNKMKHMGMARAYFYPNRRNIHSLASYVKKKVPSYLGFDTHIAPARCSQTRMSK